MIDTKYRKPFQIFFDILGNMLIEIKLTPNKITIIAFILGVFSGVALGLKLPYLALVFMITSGIFDILDGTVARATNQTSDLGGFLDLTFDRVVEGAIVIGFYFFAPQYTLLYLLFFAGAMFNFTTFMLAGIFFKNNGKKSMHYDIGIVERTETFITFGIMMVFPNLAGIVLGAFISLMILTGIIRLYRIAKYS